MLQLYAPVSQLHSPVSQLHAPVSQLPAPVLQLYAPVLAPRLVQDRELQLYDGSRLLCHRKYDAIQAQLQLTEEQMMERGILRIHPRWDTADTPHVGYCGYTPGGLLRIHSRWDTADTLKEGD